MSIISPRFVFLNRAFEYCDMIEYLQIPLRLMEQYHQSVNELGEMFTTSFEVVYSGSAGSLEENLISIYHVKNFASLAIRLIENYRNVHNLASSKSLILKCGIDG